MKFFVCAAISLVMVVVGVQAHPYLINTQDDAECSSNNGLADCEHSCHNLQRPGYYRCSCREGFRLKPDGKTCIETTCDNGYFRCPNNGNCIMTSWLCDGEWDCNDGADERNCTGALPTCKPGCQNGGTCNDDLECDCASGWKGDSCQNKDCNPGCQNNGTCNAALECDCASGWKGKACHLRECNPKCQNGGKCNADLECKCATGWKGETCHQRDCQYGGTNKADLKCDCESGWEGDLCDIKETTCDNGYFRCPNNGNCIMTSWLCDGEWDCNDGADERNCAGALPTCDPGCQNGGTCNAKLECDCASGSKGDYCDIKDCNPGCQNGGTCNADLECDCASGWKGDSCYFRDCNPKCQNGGKCNADLECDCATGWTGKTCHQRDCQNGGTNQADLKCDCASGWEGDLCQIETKCENGYFQCPGNGDCIYNNWLCDGEWDCDDGADEDNCKDAACSPGCQNNGTCNAESECDCASGWTGDSCTNKDCNPGCQNNGTCNAALECDCAPGWEGKACHLRDCNPKCQNGGKCNADLECDCATGWKGETCHQRDCQNGGTNKVDLKCDCASGWEGDLCDIKETESDNRYFRCPKNGYRIFDNWLCDGECDCDECADEDNCTDAACSPGCRNGGTCKADSKCDCASGWKGDSCQNKDCPGGEIIAKQCLKFSKERLSWVNATEKCASQNDSLATLDDPEAFQVYMAKHYDGQKFWVGGSDISDEGDWVWLNGQPLRENFPWPDQQPDQSRDNYDCLVWGLKKGRFEGFEVRKCITKFKFVCEHQKRNPLKTAMGTGLQGTTGNKTPLSLTSNLIL